MEDNVCCEIRPPPSSGYNVNICTTERGLAMGTNLLDEVVMTTASSKGNAITREEHGEPDVSYTELLGSH